MKPAPAVALVVTGTTLMLVGAWHGSTPLTLLGCAHCFVFVLFVKT